MIDHDVSHSSSTSQLEPAPHPLAVRARALREQLAAAALRLSALAEAHPALSLIALLLVAIPAILGHSIYRPLWHDELFTFYIAQQPTVSDLLRANRLIDLVPPLSFLLTRASFHLFGVNTLTTRLPEMAGFLLAMVCLFAFVRRRAGTLFGLAAATLLYTGAAEPFATEARPYGLLLGFGALGLLAWQRAREHRRFALPLLLLAAFGMLLDHVFSAYIWTALAAAEALRILDRRRIEWPLVLAWTLPLVSILTWIPLLRTHSRDIYPPAFQPSLNTLQSFYLNWPQPNVLPILGAAALMLLLVGRRSLGGAATWFLSRYEWVAMFVLLAVPTIVTVQLLRAHAAFFPRYGIPASLAISVAAALLLAFWTRADPRAALACILLALLFTRELRFALGAVVHRHVLTRTEPVTEPCEPCTLTAQLDPTLPLVDASGLAFVEMSHREAPQTLARVFYLTDPAASTAIAHANIFEGMALEKQLLPLSGTVAPYPDFIRQHRHFFVFGDYGYPEDWLLKKLHADGATLRFLGPVTSSYLSHDLYEITF
ncbi:MAG: glycosyltransferase family 39 protein [Acidobacteriota bacterium]|nr:glycosyltransferase family 39 protein [Acidobacteriota bacterium]